MKNIFLFIQIFPLTLWGQITTTKVANAQEAKINAVYDSTQNFLGLNVNQYVGQELYLKGKHEDLRKYGYEGFTYDYTKSGIGNKSNTYKCCDGFGSRYDDLAGKYFKVLEVIKHPKAAENEFLYGQKYYLKLEEKEKKDIVYFEYSAQFESSFPFIVVGYFVKQKQLLINTEYIVRGKNWISRNSTMTDMNTGLPVVDFEPGKKWKCVDLTIEEKYYTLSLVLENSKGEKIPLSIDNIDNTYWIFKAKDAEVYQKRFGAENWELILNGKVIIGMTDEMCRLSWGKPDSIDKTITTGKLSEEWQYDDQTLYFQNGLLTMIK